MTVQITQDWEAFKQYAGYCRVGTYSLNATESGFTVRIHAGRLGYVEEFEGKLGDPRDEDARAKFMQIQEWVNLKGFIEIVAIIPEELFHKG